MDWTPLGHKIAFVNIIGLREIIYGKCTYVLSAIVPLIQLNPSTFSLFPELVQFSLNF